MKVLLLTTPHLFTESTFSLADASQPLGIAYLGAVLEQHGYDVFLLDGVIGDKYTNSKLMVGKYPNGDCVVGMRPQDFVDVIQREQPDVVGVTIQFSYQASVAFQVFDLIKSQFPHIVTIAGGPHVTVSPLSVISRPTIDYAIMGEGEYSLPLLLEAIAQHQPPPPIPGLAYLKDGQPVVYHFARIMNLDDLPLPLFSHFPMERYFDLCKKRVVKMYTSRGCTFNCSFCSVPVTSQRRFIAHSPERVITEIERLVTDWRVEEIMFEDDNMSLNPKRFHRIFELIVVGGYGLKLSARNFRTDILPPKTLRLMKQAGFERIWIAPESGSQRVLNELIDKRLKLADVLATVKNIHRAGLETAAAFVIGMPGETQAELMETVRLARQLKTEGVKEFWVSIATPLEGTRLYREAVERGLYQGQATTYTAGVMDTEDWTGEQLTGLRRWLMEELNG